MRYDNEQTAYSEPTERQLNYIRVLNRRAGEDYDPALIRNRLEASRLIDRLKAKIEKGKAESLPSTQTPFIGEEWVDRGVRP